MQNFSMTLRAIFNKLINYEQKDMIPLTDDEKVLYDSQKVCFLCEKGFRTDKTNKKQYKRMRKVRDHCHFTGNTAVLLIACVIYVIKYLKLY